MIETERLILRLPTLDDVPMIHKAKEDNWPELQKWMVWASDAQGTLESTSHYVEFFQNEDLKNGGLPLFAFHKTTGDFVMASGLNATETPHVYKTGYWGAKQYLGQGYATEATKAIIDYGFEHHGAQEIQIAYYEGNEASRRVIEKCGFEFVKTLPKSHQSFATGEMLDDHHYALSLERWSQLKP
jgi:RimJ/RimL family protein N-acetyltransferase